MKRNLKLKTLLISTAIASSIIMPVTTYQALSKSNFDNIFSDSPTEIKQTKSKTTDERSQGDFQIEKAAVGSASTAIAANVLGVEHIFLWGENLYGTLGVGETAEGQPDWGSIDSNEIGNIVSPKNLKPNTIPLLENPEDINIDGGASGIQGKVVNMSFGRFTSYIAIQPDDDSSVVVYSAGANWDGEQGQGVGSTEDSVDGESSWPYNSKFTPITFYNDDNTEIVIKEILSLEAGDSSTFISFVDDTGANRVFSWGDNNSGQLGAGISSMGAWGNHAIKNPGVNAIDRPVEITNGFDIPTYTGDIVEGADSTKALDWYFSDENVGGSQNKPEFYSSLPEGVSALEGDNIPYSKDHTTDATRTPEYTYPFNTQKLPDTDWQIVKISSAPDSTMFEAQSKSTGKSALYYAGDTVYKGTWFLQKNFSWDDSKPPEKTALNKWDLMSYRPALFMFDGMSPDLFINRDSATTNTDYVDATNIQIKDFIINMYNIILVLNIDGKDHLFTLGSDKNDGTGVEGFLGGGTLVQDTIGGKNREIYEPNLGWDVGTTIGIPDGGEILQIFVTNATLGALIKTKDEQDNSKDVYSIITWGDNENRLVSADDPGTLSGKGYHYITTPTLRLTTAASKDSYASTYSAFPTTINDDALFMSNWLMDYRLETNLYDENANYVISDVVSGLDNLAFTVSDDKGNSYEYFIGSNEKKQISSNEDQIKANARDGYFYIPTQLQFAAIPVSDSFKLDNYTTNVDGIDFSMDVISGAEMEAFLPSSVKDSMVLYGDINKDGKTDDKSEAFGTGKLIDAPNLGSGIQNNTGKVEYIGRGEKTDETAHEPTYNTVDISEADQKNNIYKETYHFRIKELDAGANYDNLRASVNKHHSTPVDGVLQTKQTAKINPDTIVITNKNTDYITVELEILYDVPGYGELKVPKNSTHDGDYEVSKEPTAEDFEHVLKIYTGSDINNNKEIGTVSDLKITKRHPEDQHPQIGVEPIGTKVRFNLTGLDENTKYENMYTFFEGQSEKPTWDYRSLPGATFTTARTLQLNGFTLDQTSIDDKSFKFTLDIKQGTVIEAGKEVDYQKLDTDNVTLTVSENHDGAGEITTTPVATYIPETDSESKGLYHFSVEGLQPNTVYTIKDITINEENTRVSSHTMGSATFSPSSDNTFTIAGLPNELNKIENVNFEAGSEDGTDAPQLSFDMSIKSGGDYQKIDWDSSNTDGLAFKAKASRLGSGAGDIDLSKTSWTSTTPPVTDSTGTIQTSTITFNLENNTKYSDIKYSLDGGTTWTAAPTLDKEYSTIGITPLFTKKSFEPAEEGPNPDFARVKFDFTTGGQYGDIDKDKISFTIKDEDGTNDVPNIDKEYISGDNASGTSEEEVEWIYKVKGLQPNTKYTSLSLYYDGVLQDTAEIAEIQTTPEAIELTDFVTTSRVADVSVVDGTSDPIYNMDATVHIKSGGTSYDLNGSETVKFTDQNGKEIEGTITPQSVGPKASSIVEQDYDIHVDGLNGNNSYTMNVMTTPTDGPNEGKSVMASEPYNIGKHQMHSDSPVGNISVDVIDGTSVNLNYEVLDNTNPEMDGAVVEEVLLNTVPLTTTPGTRTLEKQIELETTIGKHTLEIDHLITNETYSDWSITVQWHGDVFSKVAMETTITIDPFTVETPPTPFPWWIVILILILLLLLILILLLLWLLNRNVFVTGTVDAEKGKVRFSINRDRRSEFDKLIEGRTLTAINNEDGIRKEYKYSLADAELNEIIIEVQGINNEINLTNIIFRKDEALNEKISAEYEKVLAKYESSLEAWTNKKDQAKENGEEFTEDKPAKPSKPKLSKDIKVIGKVDTEILPVFEGKEPKDYEEAKKSKRYVKRKLGYQKLRKKSSAKVVKKSDVAAERNKGNKIFTDSIKKIESAQVLLAEAEAFEKKLKKKITATARTL